MLKRFVLMAAIALTLFSTSVWSAIDVHEFSSEDNRLRYQKFIEELRCPKCKNNNLAGTNSQIAIDLRRELYNQIEAGQSDEQIINFMVSSYGDFVLYRPRLQRSTLALWGGPIVIISIAVLVVCLIVWRRRRFTQTKQALSDSEKEALEQMLKSDTKK